MIFRRIFESLEGIRGELRQIHQQGEHIMIDLTKLQAADAAMVADLQTLMEVITAESETIQNAINALAATTQTGFTQADIDKVTGDLTSAAANLTAAVQNVQSLPTAPTLRLPLPPRPADGRPSVLGGGFQGWPLCLCVGRNGA